MNHVHQYKQVKQKPSGRTIWRCMIVNCNHYVTPDFILGKRSICPSCQKEFVIDKIAKVRTFPKCEDCRGQAPLRGIVKQQSEQSSSVSPNQLSDVAVDIMKKFGIK